MKPSILFTILAECFLSSVAAFADFDPQQELNCETSDGMKVLVNDALVGGRGKAVAGSIDRVYEVTQAYDRRNNILRLVFDFHVRAAAPAYTVDLALSDAKVTTRREGDDAPTQYYLVPASLKVESGWDNQPARTMKCFQPAH